MNRLRELRTKSGLTQKDVANIIGKTFQAYSYYENGKREMDMNTLSTLANFYGVTIDYLLGNSERPNNVTVVDVETSALEKALSLLAQMDEEQQKTAIAVLKALAEQNKK